MIVRVVIYLEVQVYTWGKSHWQMYRETRNVSTVSLYCGNTKYNRKIETDTHQS